MANKYWVANNPSSSVTSAEAQIIADLGDVTATAAEINAVCDGNKRYVLVDDDTTYTFLAANSGKVHLMPDLTADDVLTLPAVSDGLNYHIVYVGGAEDGHDWLIDTGSNTNYYIGGLEHQDLDGELIATVYSDGNSNSKLTVLTPGAGTKISLLCDGTNWYLSGRIVAATAPSLADQS